MSTLQDTPKVWEKLPQESLDSKYEKCRNITEEIYKRIDITFQIKKLEGIQSDVSDNSDQIDSNELSNETDLFACDKDSLPSSTEPEQPPAPCEKYINNNNNEETAKKAAAVYKRPKKRFRKRVKKRPPRAHTDSDDSDAAVPLSRIADSDAKAVERRDSPDHLSVPKILIVTKDLKPKIIQPENRTTKKPASDAKPTEERSMDKPAPAVDIAAGQEGRGAKSCTMCSLTFRGERGLRRHMTMSHLVSDEGKCSREQREVKPA